MAELGRVQVAVRCRPLSEREVAEGRQAVVEVNVGAAQVTLAGRGGAPPRSFAFDAIFDHRATQEAVYEAAARGIVDSVLQGYNGTILAYGQTGTGKTHTMEGSAASSEGAGVIPRAFNQVFAAIQCSGEQVFLVRASFLEVYNEDIRDLLSQNTKNRLELHEARDSSVYVKCLSTVVVQTAAECEAVLEAGKRNRTVGATLMNQDSSRSHSVFSLTVEATDAAPPAGRAGNGAIRVGKLHLVDLAGSERQAKTGAVGDRLREATKINLSLSALGNVISALVDGRPGGHVPYRDSKLTRLLQDSLGGNARTLMLAAIGPADWNAEETLSTLRYASRAKHIQNKPRVNEDPKDAMLREFQAEIARLKAELAAAEGGAGLDPNAGGAQASEEAELAQHGREGGLLAPAPPLQQAQLGVHAQTPADAMQHDRVSAAQEAARLHASLQQRQQEAAKTAHDKELTRAKNQELARKLATLQSKLLHGEQHGGLDRLAQERATQLQHAQHELQKRRQQEAQQAEHISKLEATTQAAHTRFSSAAEQVAVTVRQLEAALVEHAALRQEIDDAQDQFVRERDELAETMRGLQHNLALKTLVMDAFVRPEEVQKLLRRTRYDDKVDEWRLEQQQQQASGSPAQRRPGSARPSARALGRAPSAGERLVFTKDVLHVSTCAPSHLLGHAPLQRHQQQQQR